MRSCEVLWQGVDDSVAWLVRREILFLPNGLKVEYKQ